MNNNKTPQQAQSVVPSANMVPPSVRRTFERRDYVTRADAPAVHARLWGDTQKNEYHLNFNGFDILNINFPEDVRPGVRIHSDGDFQSVPFIQQFLAWAGADVEMEAEFAAPVEMWNMRPERANSGRAILGQVGYPLMFGVNGLYLPDWDLLISFYGSEFKWLTPRVERTESGFRARLRLTLGPTPWAVVLRPRYYGEHLGYKYHEPWKFRPDPRPITGWSSWEAYHTSITQADLERDAKLLAPLANYGLTYMQLDDGYQQTQVPVRPGGCVGESWLTTNEKFPDGHKAIVNAARSGGFEPGIWTNATLTNEEAANAADYCLRKKSGEVIRGDWIQYTMDCLPETLAEHVTPYYKSLREAGYTYFKSDSIRHLIYDGLQEAVRLGVLEPEEARNRHRAYMEAARRGIGSDAYYLSCWGVLSQSIGVCDAMRVATDANPSWGAYSMQLRETARWFFAQRVLFTVDPDHVCARGERAWVRMMLSLASLTGSLFMISDKPADYDAARLELIRRTMPALTTRAAETGPVSYDTPACPHMPGGIPLTEAARRMAHISETDNIAPFSSLWCVHFDVGDRLWSVVLRAAVVELASAEIGLEALSLDPDKRYYAFDFWEQKGRLIEGGKLSARALEVGDAQVIALTDVSSGAPALVGSDRHVSMDAVSVARAGERELELTGFAGLEARYFYYAPDRFAEICDCEGCTAERGIDGELNVITVKFAAERARIEFKWRDA